MQENFWAQGKIDLTNCDREPIHIPNLIQPHGVLMVLKEPDLTITQISANTDEHFGIDAKTLLNQSLERLFDATEMSYLLEEVLTKNLEAAPRYLPPIEIGTKDRKFDRVVHRYQGLLIIECEPYVPEQSAEFDLVASLRSSVTQLRQTKSVSEFCQAAAGYVRDFTGFDRVMIYKFQEDGSGAVIAEALREDLEAYLGLHYPAADIPQQARALYVKNLLRFKVDVDDVSVPLVPEINPVTNAPLDMSYCATRSMSPVHTEYLKNMGVSASMSISLIRDGKLWGLIACHHYSPKYIPHNRRMACEFLAHLLSLEMENKEDSENESYIKRLNAERERFLQLMFSDDDYRHVLKRADVKLDKWIKDAGLALCFAEELTLFGETPNEKQVKELVNWLVQDIDENVFVTTHLSAVYPEAEKYSAIASGLLAMCISKQNAEYILWFRPEESQVVNWAGDPNKPVTVGELGERLTPRKSFALWQETVKGRSVPWSKYEIEAAQDLRRSILEIIVRRADELRKLNIELERSNNELDSFAYIASHDLKEPLRGIHNYSQFLIEDYTEVLDDEGQQKLQTLARLAQRMEVLTDSLLYYSRVGRSELSKLPTDLNKVLEDVLESLKVRILETKTTIQIPRELPVVMGDKIRIAEIYTNLISNAIKYNDKPERLIEIGYDDVKINDEEQSATQVFYVRDNGIGIQEKHFENIFRIFKRLHAQADFGGGSGAGLTITKKIIQRHGGNIWLESKPDEGTTFYFTLG